MGRNRSAATTTLRLQVMAAWNGGHRGPEIAEGLGIGIWHVKALLASARRLGYEVQSRSHGHGYPKPATTNLRNAVVQEFNAGKTQAEIGEAMGLERGAVGRLLAEARALGIPVIRYTSARSAQRSLASRLQTATDN